MQSVVAYTLASPEHALAVLRIAGPLQAAGIELIWGNQGADISPEKVLQADLVVIQRDFPRYTSAYYEILSLARSNGKPVLLDLDDLLLELPEDHPDRIDGYYTSALLPVLLAILQVDAITASTPPLCEYLQALQPNVWLLPNYFNDQIWNFQPPRQPQGERQPLVVGYMGGDSHGPDLETIQPALEHLLEKYGGRITLKFLGVRPPGRLVDSPRVSWTPLNLPDYPRFAEILLQQDFDLCFAPLNNNFFNECKSPIKFFEYSALGVPGVYSRVAPFESVIVHGDNGFLAGTLEEWEAHLSLLIENPSLRHRLALRAQETVREKWLLSNHAYQWQDVYNQVLAISLGSTAPSIASAKPPWNDIAARMAVHVQEREAHLERKDREIQELQAQLLEKEQLAQAYKNRLDEIDRSFAGRLMQKLWKLHMLLAPPNSYRDKTWQSFTQKQRTPKK